MYLTAGGDCYFLCLVQFVLGAKNLKCWKSVKTLTKITEIGQSYDIKTISNLKVAVMNGFQRMLSVLSMTVVENVVEIRGTWYPCLVMMPTFDWMPLCLINRSITFSLHVWSCDIGTKGKCEWFFSVQD